MNRSVYFFLALFLAAGIGIYSFMVLQPALLQTRVLSRERAMTTPVVADTPPPFSGAIITLAPVADTYLAVLSEENSSSETLSAYTWPDNGVANAALMQFNLSSIATGAVIRKATLTLSLLAADTKHLYGHSP